jgi:hypothetical protein
MSQVDSAIAKDEWVTEQETAWGNGPEWADAISRLQKYDNEVQTLVTKAFEDKSAADILAVATLYIAPESERTNPVFVRVLERVQRIKEPLLERLEAGIKFGAPAHTLAQAACNAVLRGIV